MQQRFRLRRSADFQRVRAEGRSLRHPFLIMTIAPNGLDHNRYGFIVSRHLGGAVVRNRVKRMLREMIRLSSPSLHPGNDITLVARNDLVGQPYSKINQVLESLLKRAGLWLEKS